MTIPCLVEIEFVPYIPRPPYMFAALPRIGETIVLDWDGDQYSEYVVYKVLHVPDGTQEKPAFTVLRVRSAL